MPIDIRIKLKSDLNIFAENRMSHYGIKWRKNVDLCSYEQYLHYKIRSISDTPRGVYIPKDLNIPSSHIQGFNELVNNLSNGKDIWRHQSKDVKKPFIRDGYLDDFGIQHFHIGVKLVGKFYQRTGLVVLGLVRPDYVYILDIKDHGKNNSFLWYDQEIIELIHERCPDLIAHCKVERKIVDPTPISKESRKFCRQSNINTPVVMPDGTSYIGLGGGISSLGYNEKISSMYVENYLNNKRKITLLSEYIMKYEDRRCMYSAPIKLRLVVDGEISWFLDTGNRKYYGVDMGNINQVKIVYVPMALVVNITFPPLPVFYENH